MIYCASQLLLLRGSWRFKWVLSRRGCGWFDVSLRPYRIDGCRRFRRGDAAYRGACRTALRSGRTRDLLGTCNRRRTRQLLWTRLRLRTRDHWTWRLRTLELLLLSGLRDGVRLHRLVGARGLRALKLRQRGARRRAGGRTRVGGGGGRRGAVGGERREQRVRAAVDLAVRGEQKLALRMRHCAQAFSI